MINNSALVSVILPCYKGDMFDYFVSSLESILNQTYRNIEIIVVADGDLSSEVDEFLSSISDDRLIITKNIRRKGVSGARNTGIEMASGNYVAFQDADDISKPERIHSQLDFIINNNLDLIGSDYIEFETNLSTPSSQIRRLPKKHSEIINIIPYVSPFALPTVMIKTSLLKSYLFNEALIFGEDYDLWVRILSSKQYTAGNISSTLVFYRRGHNFAKRRTGFLIAKSDFFIRLKAIRLFNKYSIILYLNLFFMFFVRLFPAFAFNLFRYIRFKFI